MGLRGLYQEAVAQDRSTLEGILIKYDEVLAEDPGNTVCVVVRCCCRRHRRRRPTQFLCDNYVLGADRPPAII